MLTFSLYLLMFAYAVSCTMLGPLLPTLRSEYGLSLSQAGLVTMSQGVGGSLSVLASILVGNLLRTSKSIRTTFAIYCASVFLVVLLPFYPALVALFFLIGASTKLMESLVNVYVADLHRAHRGFYLNILHACFGLGALLGPSVSALVLQRHLPWSSVFLELAVFCLLALAFFVIAEGRVGARDHRVPGASLRSGSGAGGGALLGGFAPLRNRVALILCSLGFLYVGFATGLSMWIPSYMNERFQVSPFWASLPVSGLWIGIITGRVIYSFLSRRFEATRLLLVSNVFAALIILIAITIDKCLLLTLGLATAGFFVGSTNPMAYALLNETFPKHRTSVSSALTFAGTLGLMIVPWLVGIVAERTTFRFGLLILGLCPCGLAVLSGVLALSRRDSAPVLQPNG